MRRLTRPLTAGHSAAIPARGKTVKYSEALRILMHQQADTLEAQRGNPPQGKCEDCNNDVPAHEIAIKCDQCNNFVCVRCIDKHDHIHATIRSIGRPVRHA